MMASAREIEETETANVTTAPGEEAVMTMVNVVMKVVTASVIVASVETTITETRKNAVEVKKTKMKVASVEGAMIESLLLGWKKQSCLEEELDAVNIYFLH